MVLEEVALADDEPEVMVYVPETISGVLIRMFLPCPPILPPPGAVMIVLTENGWLPDEELE